MTARKVRAIRFGADEWAFIERAAAKADPRGGLTASAFIRAAAQSFALRINDDDDAAACVLRTLAGIYDGDDDDDRDSFGGRFADHLDQRRGSPLRWRP